VLTRTYSFVLLMNPDWRVLLFTSGSAFLALLIFAALPAWQVSDVNTAAVLKNASCPISRGRRTVRRGLIISQVALAFTLVMAAGLFVETFRRLDFQPLGFETKSVLNAHLMPLPGGYSQGFTGAIYYRDLLDRVQNLPGVRAARLAHFSPLFSRVFSRVVGSKDSMGPAMIHAPVEYVSDRFLTTMGIPLLQGRDFDRDDRPNSQQTAIVSVSLANRLFPRGDVIGKHISIGSGSVYKSLATSRSGKMGQFADQILRGRRGVEHFRSEYVARSGI
jgi:putative ABC transport system permease protein